MNKERESLVLLLESWETEDIEKKYIYEALELLSTREDLLMNEEPVRIYMIQVLLTNIIIQFYFFLQKNLEIKEINSESMNSTLTPTSFGSPPVISISLIFKNII